MTLRLVNLAIGLHASPTGTVAFRSLEIKLQHVCGLPFPQPKGTLELRDFRRGRARALLVRIRHLAQLLKFRAFLSRELSVGVIPRSLSRFRRALLEHSQRGARGLRGLAAL